MSIPDNLLVLYLEIDMQQISNFPENLVKFIIMHELCHSISKKVEVNKINLDWVGLGCIENIKKIKKLIKDKNNCIILPSSQNVNLASDISKINCDLNQEKRHKCIDLCAKDMLGPNDQEFIDILEELYKYSKNNNELSSRLNAAKNEDYEDCKNIS